MPTKIIIRKQKKKESAFLDITYNTMAQNWYKKQNEQLAHTPMLAEVMSKSVDILELPREKPFDRKINKHINNAKNNNNNHTIARETYRDKISKTRSCPSEGISLPGTWTFKRLPYLLKDKFKLLSMYNNGQ